MDTFFEAFDCVQFNPRGSNLIVGLLEFGGCFLLKSSLQSKVESTKISSLNPPPPNSDRFAYFFGGALNVCRLVDDEERRMTIEALKQRKVEAR